jgi:hypothetical protein
MYNIDIMTKQRKGRREHNVLETVLDRALSMPCLILLLWLGFGVSGALSLHTIPAGIVSPWERFSRNMHVVTGTTTPPTRQRRHHAWNHYPTTRLFMANKDGKKKRPKKSEDQNPDASAASSPLLLPTTTPSPTPPRRVSTEINIPVKLQLQWAQINKEHAKERDSPGGFRQKNIVRTKYRRTWGKSIKVKSSRGPTVALSYFVLTYVLILSY